MMNFVRRSPDMKSDEKKVQTSGCLDDMVSIQDHTAFKQDISHKV